MLETPQLCRSHIGHTNQAAAAQELPTSSFLQLEASSSCVVISCQQSSPVQLGWLDRRYGMKGENTRLFC